MFILDEIDVRGPEIVYEKFEFEESEQKPPRTNRGSLRKDQTCEPSLSKPASPTDDIDAQ